MGPPSGQERPPFAEVKPNWLGDMSAIGLAHILSGVECFWVSRNVCFYFTLEIMVAAPLSIQPLNIGAIGGQGGGAQHWAHSCVPFGRGKRGRARHAESTQHTAGTQSFFPTESDFQISLLVGISVCILNVLVSKYHNPCNDFPEGQA